MSNLIENTVRLVEEFNNEIVFDMSRKNLDDTGAASSSLRIESDRKTIKSFGVFYLKYLDTGSGPWTRPELYKKLGYILELTGWAARNDINPYAAAYSIAHNGNRIHKDPSKGIELTKKREKLLEEIKKQAPAWVKDDLRIRLKQIKVN